MLVSVSFQYPLLIGWYFFLIYSSAFLDYWWIQPSCYIRILLHQLITCHLWYTDMH